MKTKMILKFLTFIAILNSCDKSDNPIQKDDTNDPKPELYQIDSCSTFAVDTLKTNVSFSKNEIISEWQIEKYYDLATCEILMPDGKEITYKEVSLTFYMGDSIIANCINEYKGKYSIHKNGVLTISDWIGTKEYETAWGETFSKIFPDTKNYYIQDSTLIIFTDKYKVKLIKTL